MELEELSIQPARSHRTARLGLGGALAIAGAVGLLATGFGLFGGRPSPSTASPARATSGPAAGMPTGVLAGYESPRVRPAVECGPAPTQPPGVLLVVDGVATPGFVEVISAAGAVDPTGSGGTASAPAGPRVDVPIDVTTELWIADRGCAHAWTIELNSPCEQPGCGVVLDALYNSGLRPGYASQNRFRVTFVQPGGWISNRADEDVELRAILNFPDFVARASWPIRIRGIELPMVMLGSGDAEAFTIMGCDVIVTLRNGSVHSYAESGCREIHPPRGGGRAARGIAGSGAHVPNSASGSSTRPTSFADACIWRHSPGLTPRADWRRATTSARWSSPGRKRPDRGRSPSKAVRRTTGTMATGSAAPGTHR